MYICENNYVLFDVITWYDEGDAAKRLLKGDLGVNEY